MACHPLGYRHRLSEFVDWDWDKPLPDGARCDCGQEDFSGVKLSPSKYVFEKVDQAEFEKLMAEADS